MNHSRLRLIPLILLIATVAQAQPHGTSQPGESRSELKILGYHFDNFFQVSSPVPEENINAFATDYRFAYRPTTSPTEIFAHVNFIDYQRSGLSNSYGARLGINHQGKSDDFRIFVDRQQHRPSFEVGSVGSSFGQANMTMFDAEYVHHFGDWQVGGEGQRQQQRFPASSNRDNDYNELGGIVRYKGFGWKFTPEAGLYRGRRAVNDPHETYKEAGYFAQVAYIPTPNAYFSLRLLSRRRDYENVSRVENRPGLEAVIDIRSSQRLSWLLYYSRERVRSSLPNSNFSDDLVIFGPEIRF